ncbi:MarC family NAAT transporter [Enterobacteriaceae bacterium H11S18]|uniref:MarC family NAAT transporter n=1 Tax=Dryocola clanedunensis TaxID=2925396 RepID=UPI0022F014E7|nr:MarC family NAAT transporter [Dryocola clanedunensis]MCT4708842.1 MarC family NAAT transporter [Dryocola clanedunensis]
MLDLFKAVGFGLAVLLPLANPLITVAVFLGLSADMNTSERNQQSKMAALYVFIIMVVAYYGGQLVMNTFGISIPGLRIAGGMIVAFIGFRMLFPQQQVHESTEAMCKSKEIKESSGGSIAFVPLAMPTTAGPGTIAVIISTATTMNQDIGFPAWVIWISPPVTFALVSLLVWGCLRSSGAIMRMLGHSGIEAISRLMGFLLVCMGVQFVINGGMELMAH